MSRLILTLLLCACTGAGFAQASGGPSMPAPSTFSNRKLTYKIIPAPNGTWCYDVYADGRMMIHQPSVPGLPGTEGFKTRLGAEKIALLVISKIRKGAMPPSVDIKEMMRLKAI